MGEVRLSTKKQSQQKKKKFQIIVEISHQWRKEAFVHRKTCDDGLIQVVGAHKEIIIMLSLLILEFI